MDIHYIQTLYTLMETTRLTAGLQKPERGEIGNAKWALGNEGKGHWGMEGGGGENQGRPGGGLQVCMRRATHRYPFRDEVEAPAGGRCVRVSVVLSSLFILN